MGYIPKLGLSYMGSKRILAKHIIDHILEKNPNCKYIYDLFGGGGAISFEAMQRKQIKKVFYNELNTGVVELLKDFFKNGITDKYYQWVDRETFFKNKNEDSWFGGFVKVFYSFGSNQRTYLYNKDIEKYKKNYHNLVVFNKDTIKEMEAFIEKYVFDKYNVQEKCTLIMPNFNLSIQERRLNIRKQLTMYEKKCKVKQLRQLQQLEKLQRLERLQQLKFSQKLEILNSSYEDVGITTPKQETIIYCDPPYYNTAQYQKDIDHEVFFEWVKNNPYTTYISSYNAPLYLVNSFNHRSTLSSSNNSLKTKENLYCNIKEKENTSFFKFPIE